MKNNKTLIMGLIVVAGFLLFHLTGIKPAVYGEFGPESGEHSNYLDYTTENFDAAIKKGDNVVVYVGANRCPTCTGFEKRLLGSIDQIPNNVTILAADLDRDTEFVKTYGVRAQSTTLYFDKAGGMVESRVGVDHGLDSILTKVASLEN